MDIRDSIARALVAHAVNKSRFEGLIADLEPSEKVSLDNALEVLVEVAGQTDERIDCHVVELVETLVADAFGELDADDDFGEFDEFDGYQEEACLPYGV